MRRTTKLYTNYVLSLLAVVNLYAAATYDLNMNWSDASNPNGPWAYRAGTLVLPHISSILLDTFTSPQGGWATADNRIPFWFKSSATPTSPESSGWDIALGDVVVHTQDDSNGPGNGPGNVIWTSPITGSISISGAVWAGREIADLAGGYRGNTWSLYVRDSLISSGTVSGGDPYSRANPFTFDLGSGGSQALQDISVNAGDVLRLELVKTGVEGDYVGVNFGILVVPEPSFAVLLGIALPLWRLHRRR